jgi:hypothetical protein
MVSFETRWSCLPLGASRMPQEREAGLVVCHHVRARAGDPGVQLLRQGVHAEGRRPALLRQVL